MTSAEEVLAVVGIKLGNLCASAAGAFVSLRFFEGLNIYERWSTFLGGLLLGVYAAEPLVEFLTLKPIMEKGISLAVALFGMSLSAAVIKALRDTDWSAIIRFKTGAPPAPPPALKTPIDGDPK